MTNNNQQYIKIGKIGQYINTAIKIKRFKQSGKLRSNKLGIVIIIVIGNLDL